MSRDAQVGYNHNVRYRERIYHVQTEDAGVRARRIDTHLFYRGTIIATARETYGDDDGGERTTQRMREQHKSIMRGLLRGELDTRIVALLGKLEGSADDRDARREDPTLAKVRSYRHAITHAGRLYSVQSDYYASVVTDIFHETVYIGGERQDCHDSAPPGSELVAKVAQEQHKRAIRRLRGGELDARIVELFSSLEPRKRFRPSTAQVSALLGVVDTHDGSAAGAQTAETADTCGADADSSATLILRHRLRRGELAYDVVTEMHGPEAPKIITAVTMRGTLLTSETADYGDIVGDADCAARASALANAQHKRMLEDLRRGDLDETVALLEELLDAGDEP